MAVYKGRIFRCNVSLVVAVKQRTPIQYAIVSNQFVFLLCELFVYRESRVRLVIGLCLYTLPVIPGSRVLLSPFVERIERVLEYQGTA